MSLEMTNEAVLLTCPMLGMKRRPCPMSTSHHLVIDLAALKRPPKKSLPTQGNVCAFYNQNIDWDVIHLGEPSLAGCPACAGKHRKHTYDEHCSKTLPDAPRPPVPAEPSAPRDEAQPPPMLPASSSEVPRERFPVKAKEEHEVPVPRKRVTFSDEPAQAVKKEDGQQERVKEEKAARKEESQGGKELLYRKIHDKLSDKTELYKLHLKHYHMSTASFKH